MPGIHDQLRKSCNSVIIKAAMSKSRFAPLASSCLWIALLILAPVPIGTVLFATITLYPFIYLPIFPAASSTPVRSASQFGPSGVPTARKITSALSIIYCISVVKHILFFPVSIHPFLDPRFIKGNDSAVKRLDFPDIDIGANDIRSEFRKAYPRDQPDISCTGYPYLHDFSSSNMAI